MKIIEIIQNRKIEKQLTPVEWICTNGARFDNHEEALKYQKKINKIKKGIDNYGKIL